MKRKKRPTEYSLFHLLVGLFVGFFLGGSLIYLVSLHRQNGSINLEYLKNITGNIRLSINSEKDHPDKNPKINNPPDIISFPGSSENSSLLGNQKYSDSIPALHEISIDQAFTDNTLGEEIDTVDLIEYDSVSDEVVNIVADKLIKVRTIILDFGQPSASMATQQLDSILGNVMSRKRVPKNLYFVEFWESPINFQAYKMSKNKIILYGISEINSTSFEIHKDVLYLEYLNNFYPIITSNDFQPLIPETNPVLIDQLKYKW